VIGVRRGEFRPVLRLLRDSDLRRAIALVGPRRVGKTILIRHLIDNLLASGVPRQNIAYTEIDEIQSHKDWEKTLKALADHRPDLRILVSGSAAVDRDRLRLWPRLRRPVSISSPPETKTRRPPSALVKGCLSYGANLASYERQPSGWRPAAKPLGGELQGLLSAADRALGRLDGSVLTLPNPDLFVFMYVRKEAVLSSQIGGHAKLAAGPACRRGAALRAAAR